jgi:chromosomal replication initiation ATPase DnaA
MTPITVNICRCCKQPLPPIVTTIESIEAIVCKVLKCQKHKLYEKNRYRQTVLCRSYIWYIGRKIGLTFKELGNRYNMHHTTVIAVLEGFNNDIQFDDNIKNTLTKLEKTILK